MGKNILLLGFGLAVGLASTALADPAATIVVVRAIGNSAAISRDLPTLPEAHLGLPELPLASARDESSVEPVRFDEQMDLSAFGLPCGPKLITGIADGASYRVSLVAPCMPLSEVEIAISGLSFSERLSMTGSLELEIPALQDRSDIQIHFSDGETISTELPIVKLDQIARLATAWDGVDRPALFPYDDTEVVMLGRGEKTLQILTRKIDPNESVLVRLSLKQKITSASCAEPGRGQVFRQIGQAHPLSYSLSFAARDCADIGETLELKNILEDLKLAQN